MYAGTYTVAKNTLPKYGIEVTMVEACNVEAYKKAIRPNTKVKTKHKGKCCCFSSIANDDDLDIYSGNSSTRYLITQNF